MHTIHVHSLSPTRQTYDFDWCIHIYDESTFLTICRFFLNLFFYCLRLICFVRQPPVAPAACRLVIQLKETKLLTLLPLPPQCCLYSYPVSHPVSVVPGFKPQASCMESSTLPTSLDSSAQTLILVRKCLGHVSQMPFQRTRGRGGNSNS